FILVNSISGLAGSYAQVAKLPSDVWLWFAAALVGGIIGSTLGARRFNSLTIRRVLALVLVFAGMKLLFV
ncbi:MAG: sulfite exporter TauE/SafE family protein, partial [Acidobacteria bacterium]|nr:sulfite exporter TauE/SafE family protein [Acidobacteriota bacterium]